MRSRIAAGARRFADRLDALELPDALASSRLIAVASRARAFADILDPLGCPWSCVACGGDPRECGWCAVDEAEDPR